MTPQKAPVKCVESGHFWGPRLWQARLHQAIIDQYLDQLSQVAPGEDLRIMMDFRLLNECFEARCPRHVVGSFRNSFHAFQIETSLFQV